MVYSFFISCNTFEKKDDGASKQDNVNSEQGWKSDTSPVTFDWYVNYPWFTTKWGTNYVSKYVTEKTGVSLNFIAPSGDGTETLNAMIDNGKLPDFITLSAWDDNYKTIIKDKLVFPLDQLAEKYDAYFFKVTDKQKLEWYRQNDGYVYCYPNYSLSIKDTSEYKEEKPSNQTFLVRKDIYEAIGSPDMRTTEGFLNALKKAKEKFPIVDGKPLITLGLHEFNDTGNLSLDSILPNFLAIPFEKDGQIYDRITDPEYITWLKTLRKANEFGLLSKEVFVDKRAQMEEKIAEGRYFAMIYQRSDMSPQQLKIYEADKNKIYIPVNGPSNNKFDEPRLPSDSISGWTVTLVSKSCKDPKRAIRFLSYLISEEGNRDLYLGKKGFSWEEVDGKEQFKQDIAYLLNNDRKTFYEKYGGTENYWMLMDSNYIDKWISTEPEPLRLLKDWTKGKTYNFSVYDQITPYGDTEEAVAYSQISFKWQNTLKSLLIANNDNEFDDIFNEFLNYRKNHGYEKIQAYKQKKFEENKKKLNINK